MTTTRTTNEKPLTSLDGKFYVGMTRSEATSKKAQSIFDKIDTDKNGKLDDKEICNYRDKENRLILAAGIAELGIAGCAAISVGLPPYSTTIAEVGVLAATISGIAAGSDFNDYRENCNETNQYREEHGIQ